MWTSKKGQTLSRKYSYGATFIKVKNKKHQSVSGQNQKRAYQEKSVRWKKENTQLRERGAIISRVFLFDLKRDLENCEKKNDC